MTFRVKDGLAIGSLLFVDTGTNVRAASAVITGTSGVTSAVTGALQVAGGVGVGGNLYVAGNVTATTFIGSFAGTITGVASTATNMQNGTAGQTPYQTAPGVTSFYGPGTKGDVLVSGGTTTTPVYQNTLTLTGSNVSVSTTTGALIVAGGVGIGGDLFVGATGYVAGAEIVTTGSFSTVLGGALETVTFSPAYITNTATLVTVSGTVTSYGTWTNGGLTDVTTFGDYNTATQTGYYGILDQGGVAPGYVVYIGWTSITKFNRIVFNVNYTQNSGHTVNVDLYNYDTSGWDTFAVYSGSAGWTQFALQLIDHLPYINGSGEVTARFYHVSTGNAAHRTWIDYVALEQSTTGGQGPRGATGATGATGAQGVNTSTNAATFNFFSSLNATSTTTGAVVVGGGVGVGQDIWVGGTVYGLVTTATNVAGGTAGQLHYQTAPGVSSFAGPGTAGQILVSAGTSAPTYTNTSSIYVNGAVNAEKLYGGTAGQLVYQSAAGTTSFAGPGSSGQILVSAGASAPVYTNTGTLYIGNAVSSEKLKAGTAGAIVYQSAADTTAFLALSGTAKSLLTAGASAPTYVTQVQAQSGTGSATQATGQSLVVTGGGLGVTGDSYFANNVGVANGLTVNGTVTFNSGVVFNGTATTIASTNTLYTDNIINIHTPPTGLNTPWFVDDLKDIGFVFHYYKNSTDTNAALVLANDTKYLEWYSAGAEGTTGTIWQGTYGTFKTGTLIADDTTGASSAATGALRVSGGVGVAGGMYVGGVVTATTFVGALTGTAVSATKLTGGTDGQLVYQTSVGVTGYAGPGTTGQILLSNGTSGPVYTNTASVYVNDSVVATNLRGGSAGSLVYQTAAGATSYLGAGQQGFILTGMGITSAPTWSNTTTIYVNRAVTADSSTGQAGSVANALTISTGLTGSVGTYNGSAAVTVSLNTATLMATAVTALSVPNSSLVNSGALTVTAGTGLTGGGSVSLGGSTTLTLNTATYMASAATASKVANAHTAGTGLSGTAFDGSAAQTWTLNTATLMATAVTALSATGSAGSTVAALTAGSGLTSSNGTFNGSSAVTISLNTTTYMASAVTANNIAGGTTGQLHYQSAAGTTAFAGPGTAGQLLMSAGAAVPVYTNTASIYVNSAVNAQTLYGGGGGQIVYQQSANNTTFLALGTAGQFLSVNAGSTAPTYVSTSTMYVNRAVTADNLVGGSSISGNLTVTGNLVVQGVTTTVDSTVTNVADPIITIGGGAGGAAPTSNDSKDRGIAFQWHNGTAAKVGFFGYDSSVSKFLFVPDATITNEVVSGTRGALDANLAGGSAGNLHYQSAADTTAFLANGSTNQILVQGATNPTWTSASSITGVGSLANALTIGTGLGGTSYNGSSAVTITNTGVTSNVAGTGISVNGATGAVTITNTDTGSAQNIYKNITDGTTTAAAGSNNDTIKFRAGTGVTVAVGSNDVTHGDNVLITNSGVTSAVAGTAISVSGATGAVTITNTGVTSNVAGTGVSVSGATGAVTISIGQAVATSSNVQFNSLGVGTAGSATAGEIRATNEITAYYSDRRLKENVKVIDNAVEKVLSLHGITYTPNEVAESFGYDRTVKLVGLFADEVEAVLPEATRPAPFDQDENGNSKSGENYKTIQYEKLVPLLIEAIKEQQKQIAQLSETINTLVNK